MRRYALRDVQWRRITEGLPRSINHVGVTAADNRLFVEAVIFRYRAGIPWRDLPERFGAWKNIHRRFSRRAETGVWERRGGLSTMIHALVDALGNPIGFL
jgi:transposase